MAAFLAILFALALGAGPAGADSLDLPTDMEGYYRATGLTTVKATGDKRRLKGTLIVTRADEGYDLRFSFKTQVVGAGGPVRADLIGTGEASRQKGKLVGQTETQIIWAAIAGIDPQFAFIPGKLGPRIQSSFEMRPTDEAEKFRSEIETVAIPGFEYAATRTTLHVERISKDTPQDERLPLPTPHDD